VIAALLIVGVLCVLVLVFAVRLDRADREVHRLTRELNETRKSLDDADETIARLHDHIASTRRARVTKLDARRVS